MQNQLQNLAWIEELLPQESEQRNLLGGKAYYLHEKQVLVLIETSKTRVHRGIDYPFEIWNGAMFPIVPLKQNTVYAKFTFLENHPANKNWLYLPADTEEFEEKMKLVLREIKKSNPLFGLLTKETAAAKRARLKAAEELDDEVDTTRPTLFNNEPRKKNKTSQEPLVPKLVKQANQKNRAKANKKPENDLLFSILKRKRD